MPNKDAKSRLTAVAHLKNDLFMLDIEQSIATAKISLIPTETLISTPKPSEKAYTAQIKN
jgi:hypothetical protein